MSRQSDNIRKSINTFNDLLEAVKFAIDASDKLDEADAELKAINNAIENSKAELSGQLLKIETAKQDVKSIYGDADSYVESIQKSADEIMRKAKKEAATIIEDANSKKEAASVALSNIQKEYEDIKNKANIKKAEVNSLETQLEEIRRKFI